MKLNIIFASAAALIMAVACSQPEVKTTASLPTKAETDSVSYLIGVNFGYFIKAEGDMNSPEFNEQFKVSPEKMNELFNNFITKRNNYTAEVNKAKGDEFLAANKMKDGIVVTESGLQYKIINPGNDVKAGPTDTVYVHYKGTLIDGTEFDASDPEKDPVKLVLTHVIKGWTEGLQLVGEGGKIELYIPSELGYGERPTGSIGPNSTLIFDVDVVKVGKAPAKEEKSEK